MCSFHSSQPRSHPGWPPWDFWEKNPTVACHDWHFAMHTWNFHKVHYLRICPNKKIYMFFFVLLKFHRFAKQLEFWKTHAWTNKLIAKNRVTPAKIAVSQVLRSKQYLQLVKRKHEENRGLIGKPQSSWKHMLLGKHQKKVPFGSSSYVQVHMYACITLRIWIIDACVNIFEPWHLYLPTCLYEHVTWCSMYMCVYMCA